MQSESTMMQDLFDLYKKQLLEKIDAISIFDDPEDYSKQWLDVSTLIHSIDKLIDIRQDLSIESSSYFPPTETKEAIPEVEVSTTSQEAELFPFKRKLRGGVVLLDSGDYFLPEQMVRDMGLTDGDLVKSGAPYMHENRIRRNFTIMKKSHEENPERVQLTEFVVEKTERGLCLQQDIRGNYHLLENGEPYTACLSHSDVLDYSLKPGDVVDAAYYKNNTEGISLIFKHSKASQKDYSDFHAIHFPLFSTKTADLIAEEEQTIRGLGFQYTIVYGTEMDSTVKQQMRKSHVLFLDKDVQHTKIAQILTEHFTKNRKPIIMLSEETKEIPSKVKQVDSLIRKQL